MAALAAASSALCLSKSAASLSAATASLAVSTSWLVVTRMVRGLSAPAGYMGTLRMEERMAVMNLLRRINRRGSFVQFDLWHMLMSRSICFRSLHSLIWISISGKKSRLFSRAKLLSSILRTSMSAKLVSAWTEMGICSFMALLRLIFSTQLLLLTMLASWTERLLSRRLNLV